MVVADAYRQHIPKGQGKGAGLLDSKYKGTQILAVCRAGRGLERHQKTENVFLQNQLLGLPFWYVVAADA
jgi:hypothetical protein